MKRYLATYGAYVRAYAEHRFEALNDEAAIGQAIAEFKAGSDHLDWTDYDYNNLALPSIVALEPVGPGSEIVTGHDFAANANDARDMAADTMLAALRGWQAWLAAPARSKKKLLARAAALTTQALAGIEPEQAELPAPEG